MIQILLTSGQKFLLNNPESILNAAIQQNVPLPYKCKNGRCNTCKCQVISGNTVLLEPETGLTTTEQDAGWILSCVRSASTDVLLKVDDLINTLLPPVKTLPCRINSLEKLAPDVLKVELRLPPTAEFSYLPGQYIDVIGPGGTRRSYSLAKASFADKLLELHIRAVTNGIMSQYWFEQAKVNDLLRLNGPLGTFFLRDVSNMHVVFLATGTGMAPVKAMLEALYALPQAQQPHAVTVLWGGRTTGDLYLDIKSVAGLHTFTPVLSRPTPDWTGAQGHVQDVLLKQRSDFVNTVVYACGSTAMIRDAKASLLQAGLAADRFYSDAFVCSNPSS